jgi:hypothetical protein
MLHRTAAIAIVFLGTSAFMLSLRAAEPTASPAAGPAILVLRNGQTLEGRIIQKDGLYIVDLSDGQIRIKAADVDLVCNNLEEGYQRKRAAIQVGNVYQHLELAQWCLRYNLLGQAAVELSDAKVADPSHPMIAVLDHRLKMAAEPPSRTETVHASTPGPSNEELDRMVRGLPHGTVEAFTQFVQPVLMNNCAAGGCHGAQAENGLRLFRVPTGKQASRRITQRNLYSVLSFIDRDNPTTSRLLTAPNGPHGTAKYAIFDQRQAAQYRRLADWVDHLGQQAASDAPASLASAVPFEQPPSDAEPSPHVLSQEARKTHSPPTAAQRQTAKRSSSRTAAKPTPEATPAPPNQSADPFDPELFNRRYTAEKKPPAAEK